MPPTAPPPTAPPPHIARRLSEALEVLGAGGAAYEAGVGLTGYATRLCAHYRIAPHALDAVAAVADVGPPPDPFGLRVVFEHAVTLAVHDDAARMADALRPLTDSVGPVVFVNAQTPQPLAETGQRNIFPNLRFHIDRGAGQPNQISLFLRDPRDPAHAAPRATASLFCANAVGPLQTRREGGPPDDRRRAAYDLFGAENVEPLIGDILFEHAWQAPAGVGEMVVFDNRFCLHASYHRAERGYPIGVRYLT
jgi:hypothetical protein